MKIALVTTYGPPHLGGIERIADNLYRGYARAGQEVRWIASRIPADLPAREGDRIRVPCWNAVEDWFGVPVPVWGRGAARELEESARWADVVHVVEALYLTSDLAVALAHRCGRPVVLTQNVGWIPYRSPVLGAIQALAWRTVGRRVLRGAGHVVLATPTADAFVRTRYGHLLARATTFPMGIDTDAFRPPSAAERAEARAALGLGSAPAVLFASRLVEKKGLPVVLGAAARWPEATFLVAGDGPMRPLLARASPNVRALGPVDAGRMAGLWHAADAAVLPSQGEGLPLFVQEGMACGVPVVISEDEVYAAPLLRARLCRGAPRDADATARALREAVGAGADERAAARRYACEAWALERTIRHHLEAAEALAADRAA